jgi:hypothetical protein
MAVTSSTQETTAPRKTVSPKWLIVLLVAVLAVAGGGAAVLLAKKDDATSKARDAAGAYLSGWTNRDYPAMAANADAPDPVLGYVLETTRARLLVEKQSFRPGELVRTGDTARVPYTAAMTLAGVGDFGYQGTLDLRRGPDKVWRVAFGPTALHPDLTPGATLDRVAVLGKRGRLLDRTGARLQGADNDLENNLVGSVGPLDEAQAKAAGVGFSAGDKAGQSGLERAYDRQLAGKPGARIVVRAPGAADRTLQQYPAVDGRDVRTTIDLKVQQAGEAGLSGLGRTAALVAIDARTGAVLSLVNHPSGASSTAIRGRYPPGSTFKIVTTTAALLKGLTEDSPLNCPKTEFAGGRSFKNSKDESFGRINLFQAFYHSCNTAFVNLRDQLNSADMKRAADLFGFDEKPPLPIDSFGGVFPSGDSVDPYAAAFGQSGVEASPLQMASVAAAIAGGAWHRPFVAGKSPETHPIPPNVVDQMRGMMRAVVTRGTAAPVSFPGQVSGKTGTAEYGAGRNGADPPTHAWFAGYRGDIAFCVLVPGGGFGAEVAAPAAAHFLRALDAGGAPYSQ